MLDESAFLKAAAEDHDDVARLAYADWLEERGDPRAAWARDEKVFPWMLPDGRDPVAAMLAEACNLEDHQRAHDARTALARLGGPAVPALLERIEAADEAAWWAGQVISEMSREAVEPYVSRLVGLLADERSEVFSPALHALKAAGPAAAPALPHLVRMLPPPLGDDDDYYDEYGIVDPAATILANIGPAAFDALPGLVRALASDTDEVVRAIVAIGPKVVPDVLNQVDQLPVVAYTSAAEPLKQLAEEALPPLRAALRDESVRVRRVAALALAGREPEAAMPELIAGIEEQPGAHWNDDTRYAEAIREASAFVRPPIDRLERVFLRLNDGAQTTLAGCLESLGAVGGAERMLKERLSDPDSSRRQSALSTLRTLSNVSDEAVAAVLPLLDDPEEYVRNQASYFLQSLSGPRRATLRHHLREGSARARRELVTLLRGHDAGDLSADFLRLTADPDAAVRAAAVWALAENGRPAAVRDAIRAALSDPDAAVRVAGLRSAMVRGPEAMGVVAEALLIGEADDSFEARQAAIDLVPTAGLLPGQAVAYLRERLNDPELVVRGVAAQRLGDLAGTHPDLVEAAIPALAGLVQADHEVEPTRASAGWALTRIGLAAVPALIDLLKSEHVPAQQQAGWSLVNSGADAVAAAGEALVAALRADDLVVRERAAWALANHPPAGTAPAAFRHLLRGHNPDTTEYAVTALARLGAANYWPEVSRLLSHDTDDVAACVVWAAGRLRPDQARTMWREWLDSPREAVRRAAHLELFRAGLADPLSTEDLFGALIVLATREEVTRLLAERATSDDEAFAAVQKATGEGPHLRHLTAVELLGRLGPDRAEPAAGTLATRVNGCCQRAALVSLDAIGPPAARRAVPSLITVCEANDHQNRGEALALLRRLTSL